MYFSQSYQPIRCVHVHESEGFDYLRREERGETMFLERDLPFFNIKHLSFYFKALQRLFMQ